MTITNNIFTNNSALHCPILDTLNTKLTASGNVFTDSSEPVPVNNQGGE